MLGTRYAGDVMLAGDIASWGPVTYFVVTVESAGRGYNQSKLRNVWPCPTQHRPKS